MADTTVATSMFSAFDEVPAFASGPYYVNTTEAAVVYGDASSQPVIALTTDGGASWSIAQTLDTISMVHCAVWLEQETPGDTGKLLHIVWMSRIGTDAVYYNSYNIDTDTLGTERIVDNGITVSDSRVAQRLVITKTRSGNLIVAFSTQSEIECYRSNDAGVTWTDRANVFETATEEDYVLLFPANTGDNDDAAALFWDRSADAISLKMFDESANSWTETAIVSSFADDAVHMNMDGAVRHSDGHLLFGAHSSADTTGDDLQTWDLTIDSIASPTVTAKTNIYTNQAESAQVAILINQQNDDVYLAYLKGGTWESTVDVVYHKSTDGMGVWGTEQAYSEQAADDFRIVHGGRSIGDNGGFVQWAFYDDDDTDIFVNLVNDVAIGEAGENPDARGFIPRAMVY